MIHKIYNIKIKQKNKIFLYKLHIKPNKNLYKKNIKYIYKNKKMN